MRRARDAELGKLTEEAKTLGEQRRKALPTLPALIGLYKALQDESKWFQIHLITPKQSHFRILYTPKPSPDPKRKLLLYKALNYLRGYYLDQIEEVTSHFRDPKAQAAWTSRRNRDAMDTIKARLHTLENRLPQYLVTPPQEEFIPEGSAYNPLQTYLAHFPDLPTGSEAEGISGKGVAEFIAHTVGLWKLSSKFRATWERFQQYNERVAAEIVRAFESKRAAEAESASALRSIGRFSDHHVPDLTSRKARIYRTTLSELRRSWKEC